LIQAQQRGPLIASRRRGLGGGGLQAVQKIHGPLRVRGGAEYRALVVLQNFQPIGDIGGVILADLRR
jgi:hypothetical protein